MDLNYFLSVLGLILVIEGLPYFAFPETFKKWLMQISSIPDAQLRLLGFLGMVTGILLLYLARFRMGP
jgi:uncharacterized protein YjeT (DUF2065 family)